MQANKLLIVFMMLSVLSYGQCEVETTVDPFEGTSISMTQGIKLVNKMTDDINPFVVNSTAIYAKGDYMLQVIVMFFDLKRAYSYGYCKEGSQMLIKFSNGQIAKFYFPKDVQMQNNNDLTVRYFSYPFYVDETNIFMLKNYSISNMRIQFSDMYLDFVPDDKYAIMELVKCLDSKK